jgi:hypothetical protein
MPVGAQFVARPEHEIAVSRAGVSLCLLIQRTHRALRIIDFRAGGDEAKRAVVFEVAKQHGIDRAFTLVERDEVAAWGRLGFQKEGTIVGFYKRTDAHVLAIEVPLGASSSSASGIRRAVGSDGTSRTPVEVRYLAATRRAAGLSGAYGTSPRVQLARPPDVKRAVTAAARSARALTAFEPFSRDVEKSYYACTARGGFSWLVGVETQPCFDNAFLEPLTAPRSDKETAHTAVALGIICEHLTDRGIVGCFATSPVHLVDLNAAYLVNGFRRTGILKGHLLDNGQRTDAFLWSQRLAQPGDD